MDRARHDIFACLTPRQIEIVRLMTRGKSNDEIGDTLGIRRGTVRNYLNDIYHKLDVLNIEGTSKAKRNQFCYAVGYMDGLRDGRS